ncbi:MAG: carboxypeptidase regulatory-like domain-containing protein [Thermoguttaceae bacterium]
MTKFCQVYKYSYLCLLLVFCSVLIGCGDPKPPGFPKLFPVTIHVVQEGKPLENATVTLINLDDTMKWAVGGVTNSDGNAVLSTHGKFKGAPLGKFKVLVFKQVSEGEEEYNDAMNRNDYMEAQKIDVNVYAYVEDIYNLPTTTPIEIEVVKGSKLIEVDAGPAVEIRKEFLK